MRRNNFLFGLIIAAACVILQSTFLQKIAVYGVVPDLALIVVVFTSNSTGAMKGQFLGFGTGLIQDFLSSGPLGFNALSRTIIGFIYGKIKGKLFLDSVLLPILFIIIATLMKESISALTGIILMSESGITYFSRKFLIEMGLNAALSPLIFALLRLLNIYRINDKDGF